MEAERWQKIERIYHAALGMDGLDRTAYVKSSCGGDEVIEREVRSLLAQADETGGFLEAPAMEVAARELAGQPERVSPAAIGRYRVIRLIGEGGMGSVYEAEQDQPRRRVAIKMLKPGFATPERLRRFQQESQALGRLQHPGVAQIFESGMGEVGSGLQPYFALELVDGLPLREYSDLQRLGVREKLGLIAKVCDAVHHAHQRGLIHRDLKPGNILVDKTGQPKVLDFGVARFASDEDEPTLLTEAGHLVGTLAYMSPEQVSGDPLEVDTRSDVYSLGVILYELLSGRLPYEVKRRQLAETIHTIREEEPAALGSFDRGYRGDIETIVKKALEKDKERRFASAAELGADIQRYLNDEPISSRPPSAAYQLKKFARRHRELVAGVVSVIVVLVAGVVASTSQAIRATRAELAALRDRDRATATEQAATHDRDRALQAERIATDERNRAVSAESTAVQERNRAVAEKQRADEESATTNAVNDFLRNDLLAQASLSTQARPGARPDPDLKVRTALDRAAAGIPGRFDKQPLVEASIRQTIGNTYLDLGLYPQAQIQMERTYEIRHRVLGDDHPDTLVSMNNLAALYMDQGKSSQAEPLLTKSLAIRSRVLGEENPATLVTLNNLAGLLRIEGKYRQAELLYARGLEIRRRVLGENDRSTALTMHNLASLYRLEGKYAEAKPLQTRAVEIWRAVLGEEAPETLQGMNNLAALNQVEGKYAEAEGLWNKVLEVRRKTLGTQHPNTTDVMTSLGETEMLEEKYDLAEPLLREALSNWEKITPDGWKRYYGQALLGATLAGQTRFAEAEPLLISGYGGVKQREASIPLQDRHVLSDVGERVIRLYEKWEKPEKVKEWRQRLESR